MTEAAANRSLPRLGRYLLFWFSGCVILMVVAYTQLLEYYVEFGVDLRTLSFLERTAQEYVGARAAAQAEGREAALPSGERLMAFRSLADIPPPIAARLDLDDLEHGELERRVNLDFDGDDVPVDTGDLCTGRPCDLIFLYPFQLADGEWLYLLHGIIASDRVFDELEVTDQVAFAVGSLFAGLFLLGFFLVMRNVYGPMRRLQRWSAELGTESADLTVPELRFRELDDLAKRLRTAVERERETVEKEKLFLRHASHELRTPIAILSANVELIDRLTERAERSAAEQAAFLRQYRALDDVQALIETLLWINRQTDNLPAAEKLDLRREVDALVESHRHLLDGKAVSVDVHGNGEAVLAPATALRIVLSNLVRNAFQYTADGTVAIQIGAAEVRIENATEAGEATAEPDADYGFGLGLELVALICKRFDWRCETAELGNGRATVISF